MDDEIDPNGNGDAGIYDDYNQYENDADVSIIEDGRPKDTSDDEDLSARVDNREPKARKSAEPRQTIIFRLDEPPNFQCSDFTFKYMYQRTSLFCEHDQKILCESIMDFFRQQVTRLENNKCKACK